jgi:hypothetical protein
MNSNLSGNGANSLYELNGIQALNADDWIYKSDAERRRWAFERIFRSDAPVGVNIAAAEEVISWINGGVSPPSEQLREVA